MGALDCILGDFGKATCHDGTRRAIFEQRLYMSLLPCCTRVGALRAAAPAQHRVPRTSGERKPHATRSGYETRWLERNCRAGICAEDAVATGLKFAHEQIARPLAYVYAL